MDLKEEIKTTQDSAFEDDKSLYGKATKSIPVPEKNIGIDLSNSVYSNIVDEGTNTSLDLSTLESFLTVSQSRDQIYSLIDTMCEDPTISSVLETYTEDATEYNQNGHIVWCESSNANAQKYVTFLLDSLNVDKNIYSWMHSLAKYGDIYLRLYRKSDYDRETEKKENKKSLLTEDVRIHKYAEGDHYMHYVEMEPNPAEMFDLTKFGKTYAYIKADIGSLSNRTTNQQVAYAQAFKYKMHSRDVILYEPTTFVHGCLDDNSSRTPEEIQLFDDDKDYENNENSSNYLVKRGQSLFYNTFKIWRELALLENAILLNRVTRSSLVRAIAVEVGDMPKEMVQPHLQRIKALFEQKESINAGASLSEYTNPGPIENNVYIPTRNNIGSINVQQVGGDFDAGSLTDIDYFQDKFFGSLRVPKQYFGITKDGAGFDGGKSLAIISSRYAKMVKRLQNIMCQTLTDVINLMCIDSGNHSYVNNFTIRMTPPTTQEEIDRRENLSSRVQLTRDLMDLIGDLGDTAKLEILKELMGGLVPDSNIVPILQEEIDRLKKENQEEKLEENPEEEMPLGLGNEGEEEERGETEEENSSTYTGSTSEIDNAIDNIENTGTSGNETTETSFEGEERLPSPEDLGIGDLSNNT